MQQVNGMFLNQQKVESVLFLWVAPLNVALFGSRGKTAYPSGCNSVPESSIQCNGKICSQE